MKNLKDIYADLQNRDNDQNCYYYDKQQKLHADIEDISAVCFIKKHFLSGGKINLFANIPEWENSSMRAEHMRSAFLFGIYIYDTMECFQKYTNTCLQESFKKVKTLDQENRDIEQPGSMPPSPYDLDVLPHDVLRHEFLYIWYLICLYHDVGYVFEKDSSKADDICVEIPEYLPAIPREYISSCKLYYLTRRGTSLLGHKPCVDHGIYGGLLLLKRLRNLHSSNIIVENENGDKILLWGRPIFEHYIVNAAWAIIAHNIFLAEFGTQNACKYYFLGLNQLVYLHGFSPIRPSKHPFLFLLCLVDSIEPIKHFLGDKDTDPETCNKICEFTEIDSRDYTISFSMNPKKVGAKCRLQNGCQFYQDCGHCTKYSCHRKIADDLSFLESPEFNIEVNQQSISMSFL